MCIMAKHTVSCRYIILHYNVANYYKKQGDCHNQLNAYSLEEGRNQVLI